MMDLETIKAMAMEAAEAASQMDAQPFVWFNTEEVEEANHFPFPFLGTYVPEGWEEVDRHFVDSSGLGAPDEPALTVGQFKDLTIQRMTEYPGTGWAVVEAGQFQVYVGEFRRTA